MSTLTLVWEPTAEQRQKYNVPTARVERDRDLAEIEQTIIWLCENSSDEAEIAWSVCQSIVVEHIRAAFAEGLIKVNRLIFVVDRGDGEDQSLLGVDGSLWYTDWPYEMDEYSRVLDRILSVKQG